MFKLVVLFALAAVAAAKPGYLAAPSVILPSAVSHSYRSDVVSQPLVATYAAPSIIAAPAIHTYAAPLSSAITHQSRVDLHHGYAAPLAYAAHIPIYHA